MKLIAVSLFTLAVSASAADKTAAPSPAAAAYAAKCASCHGKDGKGNANMAKMFKVAPAALDLTKEAVALMKDEELIKLITDGKGKMPAYKAKLKDAEIAGMVVYLRTFAAPAKAK